MDSSGGQERLGDPRRVRAAPMPWAQNNYTTQRAALYSQNGSITRCMFHKRLYATLTGNSSGSFHCFHGHEAGLCLVGDGQVGWRGLGYARVWLGAWNGAWVSTQNTRGHKRGQRRSDYTKPALPNSRI